MAEIKIEQEIWLGWLVGLIVALLIFSGIS
jgi:hypothetical protein